MLVLCWPKFALCCPMLTLCWPRLPLSCPYVDPVFAYVSLGNALPHSSDRNGGGDDGVTTGGSAVGVARLYNLRLPPKASGKDTGCGLWAGARIEGLPPMPPTPVLRRSMAAREMGSLCSCNGSKGSCGIFEPEGFRPVSCDGEGFCQ